MGGAQAPMLGVTAAGGSGSQSLCEGLSDEMRGESLCQNDGFVWLDPGCASLSERKKP